MSKNNTRDILSITDWFCEGKYGVMMHFLGDYRSSDEEWNAKVDAFDCQGLAEQLHEVGANHLLFTISQCGGRFCLPIEAYDKLIKEAGMDKQLCSKRDLIGDLYDALTPYGINLMLYAAAEGPVAGELSKIFTWDDKEGAVGEFKNRWFSILKEISLRYGDKVKGWWIDGCYAHYPQFADLDSPYMAEMSDALQAGNPDSLVAYNPGIIVKKASNAQEYTCGESDKLIFYPEDRFIDGIQWHVLTYLGPWWSDGAAARSNKELVNYTKACTDKGGVITFDVGYQANGHIVPEHFEQLKVLKHFIKEVDAYDESNIPESEDYLSHLSDYEMDQIPADFVNIALNKPATASSCFSDEFLASNGNDGDLSTGWAHNYAGNSGAVWWQVDLGKVEKIDGIEFFTRDVNNCERRNFEIRGSNDPEFGTYTVLLHQGDFPLPMNMHWSKRVDESFQYVRLEANGHFCIPFVSELRVFQKK